MDPMMVKENHHDGDYGNSQWVEINDYHSPHVESPSQEYNAFGYMSSAHGIPMEPAYNRPLHHPLYSTHQSPHSLITTQWPSMLTNPSNHTQPTVPTPPPPLAPVSTLTTAHPLPPLTTPVPQSTARRTLTDLDRRRMCQYHEDNPTVKQTEIGGKCFLLRR